MLRRTMVTTAAIVLAGCYSEASNLGETQAIDAEDAALFIQRSGFHCESVESLTGNSAQLKVTCDSGYSYRLRKRDGGWKAFAD